MLITGQLGQSRNKRTQGEDKSEVLETEKAVAPLSATPLEQPAFLLSPQCSPTVFKRLTINSTPKAVMGPGLANQSLSTYLSHRDLLKTSHMTQPEPVTTRFGTPTEALRERQASQLGLPAGTQVSQVSPTVLLRQGHTKGGRAKAGQEP